MALEQTFLCVDLKSFYASVECVERGLDAMTTDLVVADPERTDKTICLAVSPSLKAKGVRNRCRVFEIPKNLDYIMATPRMQLYIDYSARIYSIYLKYIAPRDIHVYSIDEVFMDVTHYLDMYGMTAQQLGTAISRDILKTVGITASCGIGSNLYLAKVAMDITAKHAQPNDEGVRIGVLTEESYRRELWDHKPLTDFWRVGAGTVERLKHVGIFTMGDIARASIRQEDMLYKLFGVDAELLIDHAWGVEPCTMEDIKNYKSQTNCLTSGQVLQCAYPADKARIVVREMTEFLVLDLVKKGLGTDSLTLHVGYDKESSEQSNYRGEMHRDYYGRTVPKPAHGTANLGSVTNSSKRIVDAVLELYDRIVNPALMVRRMNISANRVVDMVYEQYDLFTDPVALEKERRIQNAMLDIKKKFGKNAILKGTDLEEGATAIERNRQIGGHKA